MKYFITLSIILVCTVSAASPTTVDRPNVILIMVDDLARECSATKDHSFQLYNSLKDPGEHRKKAS